MFNLENSQEFKPLNFKIILDIGCSSFAIINEQLVKELNLPITPLSQPLTVKLADGSISSSKILYETKPILLKINNHLETMKLLVANINFEIMLGLPWVRKHNPTINWATQEVKFNQPECSNGNCQFTENKELSYETINAISLNLLAKNPIKPETENPDSNHKNQNMVYNLGNSVDHVTIAAISTETLIEAQTFEEFVSSNQKEQTSEVFCCYLQTDYLQHDSISIQTLVTDKVYAKSTTPLNPDGIPLKYMHHSDVFKPKEGNLPLPPHRAYDLAIDLEEGQPLPRINKIYPLAPDEQKALADYIKKALEKGWISPSQSPIGAPCFFVKKPNGGIRLCIDYRGINKITVKNKYPIPLTQDLLDRLGNAKIFTRLDLPDAYHLVRIKEGDEWKTAFRTPQGHFQYNVVSFGLTNAPSVFQFFMDDIFKELLNENLVIYLDDILIFSQDKEKHDVLVEKVLDILKKNNLYVNVKKCSFDVTELDFLGYILTPEGVKMDPAKVEPVKNWPAPKDVKGLQSFLGFSNYYRRFVPFYSEITSPLTNLLKKGVKFIWSEKCEQAFNLLKQSFTSYPIIRHFDFKKPCIVETDASDFAIGAILSQYSEDGELHPVSYFSRSLSSPELNYDVFDKELLAIVAAFKHWRHYLIGVPSATQVFSDHNNLVKFETSQQINRRQFRWAQTLFDYNFKIFHRPGRISQQPDALSRKAEFRINTKDKPYVKLFQRFNSESSSTDLCSTLTIGVDQELFDSIKSATKNFKTTEQGLGLINSQVVKDDEEFLTYKDLIYPPTQDLQLKIIELRHDSTTSAHFGFAKCYELITRDFNWPSLRKMLKKYIAGCDTCARNKSRRQKPYGLLQPLPIPDRPFSGISMDFIVDLPKSNGFDSILVIKDRLTKYALFSPCDKGITASQTANLFINEFFKLFGLPDEIVTDRGTQFNSKFFKEVLAKLKVKLNLSSAFHPQTDGSSEVTNQILEQYLRIFGNATQTNWVSNLALAQFSYNNSINSTTGFSPFKILMNFNPRFDGLSSGTGPSDVPSASERLAIMDENLKELSINLKAAQEAYKEAADRTRREPPDLQINDLVFLNHKNIKPKFGKKKLSAKFLGPFKIVEKINPVAYRLRLPSTMKIHDVFHVSLLHPRFKEPFQQQESRQTAVEPPIFIDNEPEYEVEEIVGVRYKKGTKKPTHYLVKWKGYDASESSYEPLVNLKHCLEAIKDFHNLRNEALPSNVKCN